MNPFVEVRIIQGRNLAIRDSNGLSDPFVRVSTSSGSQAFQTKVVKKNLNPTWNETFCVPVGDPAKDKLVLRAYDKDLLKKDKLGSLEIPLQDLVKDQEDCRWRKLVNIESGELEVGITPRHFGTTVASTGSASNSSTHESGAASPNFHASGQGSAAHMSAGQQMHAPAGSFYPPQHPQQSMYAPPQGYAPHMSSYGPPPGGMPAAGYMHGPPQGYSQQAMHGGVPASMMMQQGMPQQGYGPPQGYGMPPGQMSQPVPQGFHQPQYVPPPQHEKVELHGEAVSGGFALSYNELKFEQKIGAGGFGEVWKGEWAGTKVAIKKILTVNMKPEDIAIFAKEISLTSKLRHPNIVPFLGACFEPEFCLVIEFCEHGSLFHALQKGPMPWTRRTSMTLDVARGLLYLHTRTPPIVHRDVKSLNVLVTKEWKGVVSDFGLTKVKECARLDTRCGSPAWSAPEVLRGEAYGESADVFSFGIVMWEIAMQQPPYLGMEPNQIIGQVAFQQPGLRPPIPQDCPDAQFVELMQRCWGDNPHTRPLFPEIVEILKGVDERAQAAQGAQQPQQQQQLQHSE
eukprot:TRINITY_DN892_c0_g1_i1.p1 TRINITY_DN892_c0_g1~~TRINITY_DN892_c0_g1_i1.p1  ORF type:complete len:569 (-),score=165.69 TRINITY_DN892_c0_g1_i1:308-2014(-)